MRTLLPHLFMDQLVMPVQVSPGPEARRDAVPQTPGRTRKELTVTPRVLTAGCQQPAKQGIKSTYLSRLGDSNSLEQPG